MDILWRILLRSFFEVLFNFEKLGWIGGNELEDELVFAEKADKRFEPNKGKEEAAEK